MLKLDTDIIMVGLLLISSGRTQREKMAFCLGDSASFPVLSLEEKKVFYGGCKVNVFPSHISLQANYTTVTLFSYLQTHRVFLFVCCSFRQIKECGSCCKTSSSGQLNK